MRSRCGGEQVAADVGLEVDGEIVVRAPPLPRRAKQRRKAKTPALAREPGGVERLRACDRRDRAGEPGIPAADDEIDLRVGGRSSKIGKGRERHQQIADPFEAQDQDPAWPVGRAPAPEGPRRRRPGRKHTVGRRDERALAPIGDELQGHRR